MYPESADIQACVDLFVGTGAEYSYILHDRDVHADGTPKKPHYHLTLGWVKGCPGFGKLRQMCKACGAVAVSEQKCMVHDGDALEDYETHKNDPDKAQYSPEERVRSDAFYMGDYVTADEKRNAKRAEKKKAQQSDLAAFMASIMEIVRVQQIEEFSTLAQYCLANGVDMGLFWENAHKVKLYVDSVRYENAQTARMEMETWKHKAEQWQHDADEMREHMKDMRNSLFEACDELERLQRAIKDYCDERCPDVFPTLWEIDYNKPFWREWLENET